jgi:hypothetical protein
LNPYLQQQKDKKGRKENLLEPYLGSNKSKEWEEYIYILYGCHKGMDEEKKKKTLL